MDWIQGCSILSQSENLKNRLFRPTLTAIPHCSLACQEMKLCEQLSGISDLQNMWAEDFEPDWLVGESLVEPSDTICFMLNLLPNQLKVCESFPYRLSHRFKLLLLSLCKLKAYIYIYMYIYRYIYIYCWSGRTGQECGEIRPILAWGHRCLL